VAAVSAAHCGAGCTLGDIIAEFVIFGLGASVAGLMRSMAVFLNETFRAVA
jgi:hypothetical protein